MNQVSLMGRLIRDPEPRYIQDGTTHCRFALVADRGLSKERRGETKEKDLPTADFISCQTRGKTAEIISNYAVKRHLSGIFGTIQTGRYRKDGHTVYITDVVARSFDFIQARIQESPGQTTKDTGRGSYPVDNDDIPF